MWSIYFLFDWSYNQYFEIHSTSLIIDYHSLALVLLFKWMASFYRRLLFGVVWHYERWQVGHLYSTGGHNNITRILHNKHDICCKILQFWFHLLFYLINPSAINVFIFICDSLIITSIWYYHNYYYKNYVIRVRICEDFIYQAHQK